MCGLVAWLGPEVGSVEPALQVLGARGPDGRGLWQGQGITLGHTRLAMVAPESGAQPFVFDDLVLIVNGELYGDHTALLEARGIQATTRSDCEVIAHLYRLYGADLVDHLEGEWAFILWDRRARRLLAARDPLGIRPLYWHEDDHGLRLASSLEALWSLGVPCAWSTESVRQVLSHQYMLPERTLYDRVHTLPPGGMLLHDPRTTVRRWWTLPVPDPRPMEDAVGALREVLRTAITDRMRGDAPIGVQLSGGIDSAVVASQMQGAHAFTVAFTDHDDWNEAQQAAELAAHFGSPHTLLPLSQADLLDALPQALRRSGGLPINLHGAARLKLAEHARALGITGWQSGEGADELLFGYAHLRADFATEGGRALDTRRIDAPSTGVHLAHGVLGDTQPVRDALGFVPAFLEAKAGFCARLAPMVHPDLRRTLSLAPLAQAMLDGPLAHEAATPTHRSAWLWTQLCLTGSILAQLVDPMELGHGVEGRLPFLDRRVVELAMALPDDLKIRDGVEKWVLREAARGWVPESLRTRRKQPFMAPPMQLTTELTERFQQLPLPPWLDPSVRTLPQRVASLHGPDRVAADAGMVLALSAMHLQEAFNP